MALNTQIIQQLRKQAIRKKRCNIQQRYKENATRLYSEKKPKGDLEQSSQSHYNSQFNLNKQAYAQYKNTLQKEQSDAPCNFIKLYHLYLMKIALIKGIRKRSNTTSRYNPSIMKMTYQIKTTEIVPVFAARWRSICKYFIDSDNKQPKRMKKKQ